MKAARNLSQPPPPALSAQRDKVEVLDRPYCESSLIFIKIDSAFISGSPSAGLKLQEVTQLLAGCGWDTDVNQGPEAPVAIS